MDEVDIRMPYQWYIYQKNEHLSQDIRIIVLH